MIPKMEESGPPPAPPYSLSANSADELLESVRNIVFHRDETIKSSQEKIEELEKAIEFNSALSKRKEKEIESVKSQLSALTSQIQQIIQGRTFIEQRTKSIDSRSLEAEGKIYELQKEEEASLSMESQLKLNLDAARMSFEDAKRKTLEDSETFKADLNQKAETLRKSIGRKEKSIKEAYEIEDQMRSTAAAGIAESKNQFSKWKDERESMQKSLRQTIEDETAKFKSIQIQSKCEIETMKRELTLASHKKSVDFEETKRGFLLLNSKIKNEINAKSAKLDSLRQEDKAITERLEECKSSIECQRSQMQEIENSNSTLLRKITAECRESHMQLEKEVKMLKKLRKHGRELFNRIDEARKIILSEDKKWKDLQKKLNIMVSEADMQILSIKKRTELLLRKQSDCEDNLRRMISREKDIKSKGFSAAEELKRRNSEAIGSKEKKDDLESRLDDLRRKVINFRAGLLTMAHPIAKGAPLDEKSLSKIDEIDKEMPQALPSAKISEIFNISPISSIGRNPFDTGEAKDQVEEARATLKDFLSELGKKRNNVNSLKEDGSELCNLRSENERLKQMVEEMKTMKESIRNQRSKIPK